MTYNISSRLYAGLALEASSWREGRVEKVAFGSDDGGLTFGAGVVSREIVKVRVPGYVDLGVNCGYRFNRKLEFCLSRAICFARRSSGILSTRRKDFGHRWE